MMRNNMAKTLVSDEEKISIPLEFLWPDKDKPSPDSFQFIHLPSVDMGAFLSGDPTAISNATRMVDEACRKHGFFLVGNHGVDPDLVREVSKGADFFFGMPLSEKLKAKGKLGQPFGYSGTFSGRFDSRVPWKEILSLPFSANDNQSSTMVENYFLRTVGEDNGHFGKTMLKYCEAMNKLCMEILELLAMSIGINRNHYKEFFEKNNSMMRINYYPTCQRPDLTLGTGPHHDATSVTVLHQEGIPGLQVFVDGKWLTVPPNPDVFVINIGDTFKALTNGIYQSCIHRAVVNNTSARKSLTFFLNPDKNKTIVPSSDLVNDEANNPRLYPDFTWQNFLDFTQKHYRADSNTLQAYTKQIEENRLKTPL